MGLMDKVKKILFDEEEIVVPDESEKLPVREKKQVENNVVEKPGFIDYHHETEEDTIKEIKIPKEEKIVQPEPKVEPTDFREFKFPVDYDFEPTVMKTRSHEPVEEIRPKEKTVTPEPKRFSADMLTETPKKKYEEKDYHKLVENLDSEKKEKKPFKVTPIISPVYGILEKNYTPDEIVEKRERIMEVIAPKVRTYGPVSFNDQPLPTAKKYEKKESLKEDLVEVNTTISELINDTISSNIPYESIDDIPKKAEIPKEKMPSVDDIKEPTLTNIEIPDEDDEIIQTENYDDYQEIKTSGIEDEYIGQDNIEDAIDITSEFDKVENTSNIEEIIEHKDDVDDDERLEDTIETDLFNLIDSMYKSDDGNESEEED